MSLTKFNPRVGKETIKTVDSTSDVRANKDFSNPMLVLGGEILGDGKGAPLPSPRISPPKTSMGFEKSLLALTSLVESTVLMVSFPTLGLNFVKLILLFIGLNIFFILNSALLCCSYLMLSEKHGTFGR